MHVSTLRWVKSTQISSSFGGTEAQALSQQLFPDLPWQESRDVLSGSVFHTEPCAGHAQNAQGLPGKWHLPLGSLVAWARITASGLRKVLPSPLFAAQGSTRAAGVGFCVAHIPGDPETMKPWLV